MQEKYSGAKVRRGSHEDMKIANAHFRHLGITDRKERSLKYLLLLQETERHWREIQAVREALVEHGTLHVYRMKEIAQRAAP